MVKSHKTLPFVATRSELGFRLVSSSRPCVCAPSPLLPPPPRPMFLQLLLLFRSSSSMVKVLTIRSVLPALLPSLRFMRLVPRFHSPSKLEFLRLVPCAFVRPPIVPCDLVHPLRSRFLQLVPCAFVRPLIVFCALVRPLRFRSSPTFSFVLYVFVRPLRSRFPRLVLYDSVRPLRSGLFPTLSFVLQGRGYYQSSSAFSSPFKVKFLQG